jgi:hypothetical protein
MDGNVQTLRSIDKDHDLPLPNPPLIMLLKGGSVTPMRT